MSLTTATIFAACLALASYATMARIFVVPATQKAPLSTVLILLLWPHTLRFVALSLYSSISFGTMNGSADALWMTIYGDTASAVVSLLAIWVIAKGMSFARPFVWSAAILGLLDLFNAIPAAFADGMFGDISNLSWTVVVFFVPALIVSYVLLFWQLYSRRTEGLTQMI